MSLHVHGSATAFAWILPVKASALVDLASDAWLESLEDATAPRVVPPDVTPACGAGGVEVEGDIGHAVTTAPDAVAVAADPPSLVAVLGGWGFAADRGSGAGARRRGGRRRRLPGVALLRCAGGRGDADRARRRLLSGERPLAMTGGASTVNVTAYAFSAGPAALGTGPSLALNPSLILWLDDGTSTYASVRDAALSENPGAWLIEDADPQMLFQGEPIPGLGAIPALTPTYFSRAGAYGDASGSPEECTAAATALASSDALVAPACPSGALSQVGQPGCQETVDDGQVSPDPLRCGGIADDLAMALSGLAPAAAWLTRARSVIAPVTLGVNSPLAAAAPAAPAAVLTGPLLTCIAYDNPCGADNGGTAPAPPTSSSSSGSGSSSGSAGQDPGSGNGVGSAVGTGIDVPLDSDDADQGCGGDSSDDSGDSCSGDPSGGDPGSAGDDCSGSPSSDDCALAGRSGDAPTGRRHGPASRLLLLVVAGAAVARRRGRGSRGRLHGRARRGREGRPVAE